MGVFFAGFATGVFAALVFAAVVGRRMRLAVEKEFEQSKEFLYRERERISGELARVKDDLSDAAERVKQLSGRKRK